MSLVNVRVEGGEERSDSSILPTNINNNSFRARFALTLVASLLALPPPAVGTLLYGFISTPESGEGGVSGGGVGVGLASIFDSFGKGLGWMREKREKMKVELGEGVREFKKQRERGQKGE